MNDCCYGFELKTAVFQDGSLTVTVKKLQKMLWIDTGKTSLVAKIVKILMNNIDPVSEIDLIICF